MGMLCGRTDKERNYGTGDELKTSNESNGK
jgi:hypothetical protein